LGPSKKLEGLTAGRGKPKRHQKKRKGHKGQGYIARKKLLPRKGGKAKENA